MYGRHRSCHGLVTESQRFGEAAAVDFVDSVVGSAEQPIVMFSLAWCEFCWSVRKFFKALDVPYRAIDLDSVAYQQDNWGGEIRVALR